jgi:hypothetical protein
MRIHINRFAPSPCLMCSFSLEFVDRSSESSRHRVLSQFAAPPEPSPTGRIAFKWPQPRAPPLARPHGRRHLSALLADCQATSRWTAPRPSRRPRRSSRSSAVGLEAKLDTPRAAPPPSRGGSRPDPSPRPSRGPYSGRDRSDAPRHDCQACADPLRSSAVRRRATHCRRQCRRDLVGRYAAALDVCMPPPATCPPEPGETSRRIPS